MKGLHGIVSILLLVVFADAAVCEAGGGKDDVEMVFVPGGEFTMGRTFPRGDEAYPGMYKISTELPSHTVNVAPFYIDKYEVTNARYGTFVEATGRKPPETFAKPLFNHPDQSVVAVTWVDAFEYCKWVGKRLPTEAEWEKAARGTDKRRFAWGNEWDPSKAHHGADMGGVMFLSQDEQVPKPPGIFPDNVSPYGAMDMTGNVWEYTSSLYKPYPYDKDDGREDLTIKGHRVYRGAGHNSGGGQLFLTYREFMFQERGIGHELGIRCTRSADGGPS